MAYLTQEMKDRLDRPRGGNAATMRNLGAANDALAKAKEEIRRAEIAAEEYAARVAEHQRLVSQYMTVEVCGEGIN